MKHYHKPYWDFQIDIVDIPEGKKNFGGRRLSSTHQIEFDEKDKEKMKLVVEHNRIIDEIRELERKVMDITREIFNPEKTNDR